MPTAVTRRRRAVRAATFGLVLTVSAVLAHVLAGGMLPGRTVVAGSAVVLCALGWLLAGRDRSPLALGAAALAGQVGLHLTFSLTMPGAMTMSSLLCGHMTAATASQPGLVPIRVLPAGPSMTSHQMLLMLAAHAIGGVVVLLALRSAEAVVGVVAGVLTATLLRALPPLSIPAVRRMRAVTRVRRPAPVPLLLAAPRRGPPAFAA